MSRLAQHPERLRGLDDDMRSRERAALDEAVKALRTVEGAGLLKAQETAHEALRRIEVLCPGATKP